MDAAVTLAVLGGLMLMLIGWLEWRRRKGEDP